MMHGADPETPATLVENVSRANQRILPATLATLPEAAQALEGPAVILYGLAPRAAAKSAQTLKEAQA
jgi:siroheme synthase